MRNKSFVLVALSLLLLFLCACGSTESDIVGEWQYTTVGSSYLKFRDKYGDSWRMDFDETSIFSFYNDGTWKLSGKDNASGTYSIGHDGTAISFVAKSRKYEPTIEFVEIEFSGNLMTLKYGDKFLYFTKYSN